MFEFGDAYESAYGTYVDDININKKTQQVELIEL